MRDVVNRLEHMGCINRDIRLAVALTGPNCEQLLSLRADFSFECGQLLNQLTAELAEHQHARAASRLLDGYVAMHRLLTGHQQRWSQGKIARDQDGYVTSSHAVYAAVINFLEDSLSIVQAALAPTAPISAFAPVGAVRLTGTG